MSEHVERLRTIADHLDKTLQNMSALGVDKAADHLERCEKLLARYYASHNDPKFGPCDCDACVEYRKVRVE